MERDCGKTVDAMPRQRCPLARLALAGGRAATGDPAVEGAGLDLLLDELHRGVHALLHRPGDLRLRGDREVAPDVLEERPVGLGEVEGVVCEALHRVLAGYEHGAARLELGLAVGVRIDEILDRPINRARVLIHAVLQLESPLFDH